MSPLLAVLLLGACFWGIAIGAHYWTSQPITMTVSVAGHLDAKANVNPLTAWNTLSKIPYDELVEEAVFFDGGQVELDAGVKYVFVRLGATNAQKFYTRVYAEHPSKMEVSCTVALVDRRDIGEYPTTAHWHELGPIALDGVESLQLTANGDPQYLTSEPAEHMRYILYAFNVGKGTLPPGDHLLTVEISLGDTP